MSRIDPTVKKETGYIAGWVLLLSAVMELVFLLTGHMDYTVPLGNLLGGVAAILNFFLMGCPHNTLPFQENCKQGFDKVKNL